MLVHGQHRGRGGDPHADRDAMSTVPTSPILMAILPILPIFSISTNAIIGGAGLPENGGLGVMCEVAAQADPVRHAGQDGAPVGGELRRGVPHGPGSLHPAEYAVVVVARHGHIARPSD
jgi:hypothetical protein